MADQHQLDILKQGIERWNEWRKKNRYIKVDLSKTNLTEVDLMNTDLRGADLSGANFNNANLSGATLNRARLIGASLIGANLSRANFIKADLSKVYLMDADLSGATFSGADFIMAILRSANIQGARFTKANLSHADFIGADLSRSYFNGALLFSANLINTNLTQANFSGADLSGSNLSYANLYKADFTGCRVHAISTWNIRLEETTQLGLVITRQDEPTITVDNLELAQFIYLLLEHKKLRDVLNATVKKGILLLGHFQHGGLELLQAIAAKLRDMNYLPIIFDFPRPDQQNARETVKTLTGLSRFVIAELSGPSVPLELEATILNFEIPFVPIIEKGGEIPFMLIGLLKKPWVLAPVEFASKEHLMELLLSEVIEPAEKKAKELEKW